MNKKSIDCHVADERKRLSNKNYYGIREHIKDQLDFKQGIIFSRYTRTNFNNEFDIKHNYNLGYPSKNIKLLPQSEYNSLKIYTLSRWLSYKGYLK